MAEPLQVWVRNDQGRVWGPVMVSTLELLFDNQLIPGRVQVSLDGSSFVAPVRLPQVRDAVPKQLWGDGAAHAVVAPEPEPAPLEAELSAEPLEAELSTEPLEAELAAEPLEAELAPDEPPPAPPPPTRRGPPTLTPAGPPSLSPSGPRAPPTLSPKGPPALSPAGPKAPSGPPKLAPAAGPGAVARVEAKAAEAVAAVSARAATDRRILSPELGAPAPPPPPPKPIEMPATELPASGDLTKHSALSLYYLAGASDATGLLTLTLSDRTIQIHFRKGNPEFLDSTHAEDQLATFLVKNQLATFAQLGQAEKEKDKFGGELIGALFGMGLLNPSTAFQHLAVRAGTILVRGLLAEHGTFTWVVKDLPAHKAMPLGNRWAVVSEQIRKLPAQELRRRLADALDLPVMKSGGRVAVADLRLTPQETRALSHFDGVRSLAQLMHDMPADADHLLRVAFLLKEMESVSFASVRVPAPAPVAEEPLVEATVAPPSAPKPVAPAKPSGPPKITAPGASPGRPPVTSQAARSPGASPPAAAPRAAPKPSAPVVAVDAATELKQLKDLWEKLKKQDYYDVLGIKDKDKADASSVKFAYFKLAKLYHPDTVPPDASPELAKLKADIFAKVGEANRTLSDDKLRADYLEEVKSGGAGEKVDIASILAAEESFRKGEILVKAKKFADAVKFFDEAIKGQPEAEYYAWRGYAKYFTYGDKQQGFAEANKDIGVCTKKNENIANAWYFLGHLARLMGDNPTAKKQLNRCLRLNAEHLDAQRELRLLK